MNKHNLIYRLQPITAESDQFLGIVISTVLSWAALFGAAFVVGYGLRLGWGG